MGWTESLSKLMVGVEWQMGWTDRQDGLMGWTYEEVDCQTEWTNGQGGQTDSVD